MIAGINILSWLKSNLCFSSFNSSSVVVQDDRVKLNQIVHCRDVNHVFFSPNLGRIEFKIKSNFPAKGSKVKTINKKTVIQNFENFEL